jgi:hypothetical protein
MQESQYGYYFQNFKPFVINYANTAENIFSRGISYTGHKSMTTTRLTIYTCIKYPACLSTFLHLKKTRKIIFAEPHFERRKNEQDINFSHAVLGFLSLSLLWVVD